jgi:hypothetical protein
MAQQRTLRRTRVVRRKEPKRSRGGNEEHKMDTVILIYGVHRRRQDVSLCSVHADTIHYGALCAHAAAVVVRDVDAESTHADAWPHSPLSSSVRPFESPLPPPCSSDR